MDKNEIVRKYKWFRVLRGFLRMLMYLICLIIILVIVYLLFHLDWIGIVEFIAQVFISILVNIDKLINLLEDQGIFSYIVVFVIIPFFCFLIPFKFKLKYILNVFLLPFYIVSFIFKCLANAFVSTEVNIDSLLNLITHHFEKKWGMTEEEIKEFISKQEEQEALRRKKREILGRNPVKYVFPFIRELCKLNKGAKDVQEALLSDFLSKEEVEIIFDDFQKLGSLEDAILCWRERSLPERLSFMRFLFKLAILQDGIHNDEWNMLMNLIWQLRFSNYYREDFRYRYFSLRTEFYDYERKSSSSTEDNSASTNNSSSSLKPYFTLLGLEETASDEEIKRAYHNLALQHHPDMQKNADRIKECEAMMAKINEAYEKLRG